MREELIRKYGAETVRSGGLKVYTTIDRRMQRAANRAMQETLYYDDDPPPRSSRSIPQRRDQDHDGRHPGRSGNQFNLAARRAGRPARPSRPVLAEAVSEGVNPDTTSYPSRAFPLPARPVLRALEVETCSHTYLGSASITQATLASDNTVLHGSRSTSGRRTWPPWRTGSA